MALVTCAPLAFAQYATSSLTGQVTAIGSAKVLAFANRVTVTATSKALQVERTTATTDWGEYWLTAMPPGEYEVSFSKPRHQTVTKRVVLEAGRVGRIDTLLEASEDEESVTSTAKTSGVTDTTAITTHYSDETLDRLPIRRDPAAVASISAGLVTAAPYGIVDDALSFGGHSAVGQDALEEVTVFRGALPADSDELRPAFPLSKTRSGGEDLLVSLRDTITGEDGPQHLIEAAAGNALLTRKLWFFVDAWRGSEARHGDLEGAEAKVTWQPGARHSITAAHVRSDAESRHAFKGNTSQTSLRYTVMTGPWLTTEAVASRSEYGGTLDQSSLSLKTSAVTSTEFGAHVLSAGVRATDRDRHEDTNAFFVNDRWMWGRLTMNLGARRDYDRIAPRAAATVDLRNDGRHAIVVSLGDYNDDQGFVRELTAGYAMAIGHTGTARVDAIRRDSGANALQGLEADFDYSLFDRFYTGANYSWLRADGPEETAFPQHVGSAWAGVELPVGDHEFGVTLLERHRFGWATDLALRYTLPLNRSRITLAVDGTNLFDRHVAPQAEPRAYRGWVRVRL